MTEFKSFISFIKSMLSGDDVVKTYFLETETSLQSLFENIKDIKPFNYLDKKTIKYENDEITIEEIYDTGIRRKSYPKIVFNKAYTSIIKHRNCLEITIEIERVFLARIGTVILILSNLVIMYLFTKSFFQPNISIGKFTLDKLNFAIIQLFAFILLLIVWKIAEEKYKIVINHIKEFIN